MKFAHKLLLACVPVVALAAACGGGDTEDRLDVADPVVRFVHAAPTGPNLTLYRATVAQSDATNVPYKFASDYFDIDTGVADWPVKTAPAGVTIGTVSIDPLRGTRYTIVGLSGSALASDDTAVLIIDPYNKALTSDSTRLRLLNASFNAASVDLYMTPLGTDITPAGVMPFIAATAFKTSGPSSGSDSADIPGATYQVTLTTAGTKTILFNGQISFAANKDILLISVPDSASAGGIKLLEKVDGIAGLAEVAPV